MIDSAVLDMDPLCHTLVGGILAEGGLKRHSTLATTTLILGANLPDLDVVSYFGGGDAALHFRRGWTHGVLALVVLPVLLTGLMVGFDRWRRRRGHLGPPVRPGRLLLLAGLAVASHPLLDWLNVYGVRILMPFDGRWLYGDAVFIVDPWLWLLFGGALFLNHSEGARRMAWWSALAVLTTVFVFLGAGPYGWARWLWSAAVAGLIVARLRRRVEPSPAVRGRRARVALAAGAVYALAMVGFTSWAKGEVAAALSAADVEATGDFMVGPDRVHPLVRLAVVPAGDGYRVGSFHAFRRPRLRLAAAALPLRTPRTLDPAVVEAARAAPCVRGMMSWVRYPFYDVETTGDGYLVYILDARYVRGRTRGFGGATVELDRDLKPVGTR